MTSLDSTATSSEAGRARSLTDPRARAFLPLLYVAWADGDLTPEEVSTICATVAAADPSFDCIDASLDGWLDAASPPSATELQRLLFEIRRHASSLPAAERRTLAELGRDLALAGGHHLPAAEEKALLALETALGLPTYEASRGLIPAHRLAPQPAGPPPFDVTALARRLDSPHRELRRKLKRRLAQPDFAYVADDDRDAYRARVLSWCRQLASEGYGALGYPRSAGGAQDQGAFIAAFETLAFHDLSLLIKFGVQFGLFGGSIQQLGTRRHHDEYLGAAGRLELPGCFAMTETGHGSNVYQLETTARYDRAADEFVIVTPRVAARKDYIGNAARDGRLATVFAQLQVGEESYGVHAFLVPIRDDTGRPMPGVTIEDCGGKMGLNGVDNGRLLFDQVRVPRTNLLDRFGSVDDSGAYSSPIASPTKRFFTMLGTLVGGRVSVALAAASAAKSALTIAVRYAGRRRQFGAAGETETQLLDYLSHQERLFPRLATTYGLHFALRDLVERFLGSPDEDRREVEALAAGLKAFSTWHATDTLQEAREACGGQGYLAENRIAALKADTDVFTTFEGDNTVLLQLVAKSLLSGFQKQFSHLSVLSLARYLRSRAATTLTELNPIVTRKTDEAHLRDADFHRAAFGWREEHLLGSVARRLKKRIDGGMDSFEAMIECQDHLLELAHAHVERVMVERFGEAVEATEEADVAATLELLRQLFALSRIERDRGWFLEHGYLDPPKSKAIRKLVNRLLGEIRPAAPLLVDAFEIPDELLAAPIAT